MDPEIKQLADNLKHALQEFSTALNERIGITAGSRGLGAFPQKRLEELRKACQTATKKINGFINR